MKSLPARGARASAVQRSNHVRMLGVLILSGVIPGSGCGGVLLRPMRAVNRSTASSTCSPSSILLSGSIIRAYLAKRWARGVGSRALARASACSNEPASNVALCSSSSSPAWSLSTQLSAPSRCASMTWRFDPSPDRATTGTVQPPFRSSCRSHKPPHSSGGIFMSARIRSAGRTAISARAACPSVTYRSQAPASRSGWHRVRATSAWSSATRMMASLSGLETARIGGWLWTPGRAAVPPVEGPCLADEPTDCDDGVGEVEERVDDFLAPFVAALEPAEAVMPGVGPLPASAARPGSGLCRPYGRFPRSCRARRARRGSSASRSPRRDGP